MMKKKYKFQIPTALGLISMFLLGLAMIVFYETDILLRWINNPITNIINSIINTLGGIIIGISILSFIIELHTFKKVVADGFSDIIELMSTGNVRFNEYTPDEILDRIRIQFAKQKLNLMTKSDHFNDEFIKSSLYPMYEALMMSELKRGIVYSKYKRLVTVEPNSEKGEYVYRIKLHIEIEKANYTSFSTLKPIMLKLISEKQRKSFSIIGLKINNENYNTKNVKIELLDKESVVNSGDTVRGHSFNYGIKISLPVPLRYRKDQICYQIEYEYKNYEQSCFLTNALSYPTKSIEENYVIVGDQKSNYNINGFFYSLYSSDERSAYDKPILQRIDGENLVVFFNQWLLSGSGTAVVVRRNV